MKFSIVIAAIFAFSWLEFGEAVCGYKSCNPTKSPMINVHLVPHSHDDVGWLKTVTQYYYGSRNNIQHAGVQYILDSVVTELLKDPERRFVQVETAFFSKWFKNQPRDIKKDVKKLVAEGRLEFIGGAWSMNDEATVHYQSIIDQFSLGLRFLKDNFGTCGRPRVGWQIDPFGHSREMASIFAQMGYDGEFFSRMDWVEKGTRLNNLTAEMIWLASENLDESSQLFTSLLFNHYSAPAGFCFDNLCTDPPIIDDDSPENNVDERVTKFIKFCQRMNEYYRSNHLLVTMGDDFNFENAGMNYKNIDKLIKYVNERQLTGSKINLLYSTPSCYMKELHKIPNITWPTKSGDFFPYSTDPHSYWTGYFSSRPTQKKFERDGNHFLQVTKQLMVFAKLTSAEAEANLNKLRHVMGIMQHHDAITGTEKQHVANDYNRLLTEGFEAAKINNRLSLRELYNSTNAEFVACMQLNISLCEFTQKSAHKLVITVVNPLSRPIRQYIRIPVPLNYYLVTDAFGRVVNHQTVPVPDAVSALNGSKDNQTRYELVFEAVVSKLANFYVNIKSFVDTVNDHYVTKPTSPDSEGNTVVKNSLVALSFKHGILERIEMNGIAKNVRQNFLYYRAAAGNNMQFQNRSSGAYIFRPKDQAPILASRSVNITIYEGKLVKEVHQYFNEWLSQVIRIYEEKNLIEFEWLVGPIPIVDNVGKEIITRFTSDIASQGVFYTDSNGREMLRRVRNEREGFKPNLNETVSSNYYPVTSRLSLQGNNIQMTLLNDRAQGGTSLRDGELELMLHRRLLRDDAFGVGEALNETYNGKGLVARGKIQLMLNYMTKKSSVEEKLAAKELHLPFYLFFSNSSNIRRDKPVKLPVFSYLPTGIEVLTLEPFGHNQLLLRLENFLDKTETDTVIFSLRSLFDDLDGQEIRETTLDGNMKLSDMKRMKFPPDGKILKKKPEYITAEHKPLSAKKADDDRKFIITLKPMQIRTFVIKTE